MPSTPRGRAAGAGVPVRYTAQPLPGSRRYDESDPARKRCTAQTPQRPAMMARINPHRNESRQVDGACLVYRGAREVLQGVKTLRWRLGTGSVAT